MRTLDRFLQRWREAKAARYVPRGAQLLDVGCFDGALLNRVKDRVATAIGVDPLASPRDHQNVHIVRASFPSGEVFVDGQFECITMLAVLEHLPDPDDVARECYRLLRPGGRVIITVPRPFVDHILRILMRLRLIDGMSLEEHHKYDINQTPGIFRNAGFSLAVRRSFQFGLNHLFVFEKAAAGPNA